MTDNSSGLVILITLLNILVYKLEKLKEAQQTNRLPLSVRQLCRRFTLKDIQLATNSFQKELVIGRGGFGMVYKGIIDSGERIVAVKQLKSKSKQGRKEFHTEIEMLSQFRHSHIVPLIGYCDEREEMILVYEYMPSGNLADHLHKRVKKGDTSLPPLSWEQRLKICVGAAHGLDYLHTGTSIENRVIHRDVKTTNILLDENLEARISDFGLSKLGPANQTFTYVSTRVKGTPGYLDPYYVSTHRLTRKSDVYAFGVVLLEVLCGRRAVDTSLDEEQTNLAGWAQHCFKEGLIDQITDPNIKGVISSDSLNVYVDIAIKCLCYQPKHRPTMAEVVVGLESALTLQRKSAQSPLVEIMPFYYTEVVNYSKPEVKHTHQNQVYKYTGIINVSNGWNHRKQSSAKTIFRKRTNGLLSVTGRNFSGNVPGLTELQRPVTYNYKDLKSATKNFSEEYKVGVGGSGDVYKGIMKNGNIVAVKRLALSTSKAKAGFESEVRLISNVHHRNLVRILGSSSKGPDLLLVYEYMENGSLDRFLYGGKRGTLNWQQRFDIIFGIARGLAYLHEQSHVRIIHRDIKPGNILLDDELQPKIADFGLARILPEDQTHLTTRYAGTLGYTSPEYALQGQLSEKVDTYSFGIVLIEIISGRRCSDAIIGSGTDYLLEHAWKLHENDMHLKLVDETLDSDEYKAEDVKKVIEIALMCTQSPASLRPTMSEVVFLLSLEPVPISKPILMHSSKATATLSEFIGR